MEAVTPPPAPVPSPGVRLRGIGVRYGGGHVLASLNMDLPGGRWTCLLGASGSGKTTLVRRIAGLTGGAALSGSVDAADNTALGGRIAYMAQSDLLLPWLSVEDNVALGSRLRGEAVQGNRVDAILSGVGLAGEKNKLPRTLSGGMGQRVALARTLYENRALNLLDEPFSKLDAITRHRIQNLALQLLHGKTVLLVTHDPLEAIRLGHRLYVLAGRPARARELQLPGAPPRDLGDAGVAQLSQRLLEELAGEHRC
ncbi:MAG: ABC transporter ATP-binding protein [Gammaproteobacteria bacterium]|nr:ABC transporter ATP-binding protein [Gammaproteobacteria bacterium]